MTVGIRNKLQLKTGLEIEEEFNKVISLAITNKISHIEAERILDELFKYGEKTGKFSKKNVEYYMDRKNRHKNERPRTHLEFALNIYKGQKEEHEVFLYFVEWLEKSRNEKIEWELNGSDLRGYMMIVNKNKKEVIKPDYTVRIENKRCQIEAKSFRQPPWFKIANLKEYEKCNASMIVKYNNRYYLFKLPSIIHMLKNKERIIGWNQEVIKINQNYINELIEKKFIKEISDGS